MPWWCELSQYLTSQMNLPHKCTIKCATNPHNIWDKQYFFIENISSKKKKKYATKEWKDKYLFWDCKNDPKKCARSCHFINPLEGMFSCAVCRFMLRCTYFSHSFFFWLSRFFDVDCIFFSLWDSWDFSPNNCKLQCTFAKKERKKGK